MRCSRGGRHAVHSFTSFSPPPIAHLPQRNCPGSAGIIWIGTMENFRKNAPLQWADIGPAGNLTDANGCHFLAGGAVWGVAPIRARESAKQPNLGPRQSRRLLGEEEQGSERSFRRRRKWRLSGLCDDGAHAHRLRCISARVLQRTTLAWPFPQAPPPPAAGKGQSRTPDFLALHLHNNRENALQNGPSSNQPVCPGPVFLVAFFVQQNLATVYKGNIIKNLIMDCQSYTKYRPNETTGGIFVSWRRKEELPTGA